MLSDTEMDSLDMQALLHYAQWNDVEFHNFTEGPRHRRALLAKAMDKKSSGLLREKLIAMKLGLVHNTKMHSTTNGVTTFDGIHPVTQECYEIKAEEHTTNNPDRRHQSGQISGTGVFSTVVDQITYDKLITNNPIIAHGMFGDGRLLCLATFRLSETYCAKRIHRYCFGESKTEPRYALVDWVDSPGMNLHYVSAFWPDHIAPKYKKLFQTKWMMKTMYQQELFPVLPDTAIV